MKDVEDSKRWAATMWSPEFLGSVVAAFVAGCILMLNDRHQSNMMITEVDGAKRFAHIDFGWFGLERPTLDAGDFPIPAGLKKLLVETNGFKERTTGRQWPSEWAKLCDICWDALQALRQREEVILESWSKLLDTLKLYDPRFGPEIGPTFRTLRHRLLLSRSDFDALMERGTAASYWKNRAHSFGQFNLSFSAS